MISRYPGFPALVVSKTNASRCIDIILLKANITTVLSVLGPGLVASHSYLLQVK